MKILPHLERRYGRYAIRNLTLYIAVLNIAVVVLTYLFFRGDPFYTVQMLALFPEQVFKGQIWRLVTFVFLPDSYNIIWIFFTAYMTYIIGAALDQYWGSFKLNVYFLTGVLGSIIAAFLTGAGVTGYYVNLSLFLAYATLFPEQEFLLFFFLPVKAKYLGILDAVFLLYEIFTYARVGAWHMVVAILVALANYFLFFGRDFNNFIRLKRQVSKNRKRFFGQMGGYYDDRNRRY